MVAPRDPVKYAAWLENQKLSHVGKHPSQTTLDKMSESHKGLIPWNRGISSSESTKRKQSESLKNKPKPPYTKDHCNNIIKNGREESNVWKAYRTYIGRYEMPPVWIARCEEKRNKKTC